MTPDIADDAAAGDPNYAFKPSLMGAISQFTLKPDALEWQIGRYNGRLPYDRIRAVRLSYRPVTMQSHRFITELWAAGTPKMQIVSSSWRSMVEQEPRNADYTAFVRELHRRLGATGVPVQFSTGLPFLTYWVGVIVFAGVLLTTCVMVVRALLSEQWAASAFVGLFFAVFSYQLGTYFYRNRPGRYRADAIPPGVLPKS